MNCKPGDLAVFVRSGAGNEGRIVRCVRLAFAYELPQNWEVGPTWLIDQALPMNVGGSAPFALDEFIRPIRDQDGEDQTLTWAGKPSEVTA